MFISSQCLYGMQAENVSPATELPTEIKQYIAGLSLESTLGTNFEPFKHIETGKGLAVVGLSFDSKLILTGSFDGKVRLWDIKTKELLQEFKGHKARISSVAFNSTNTLILTGSQDGTARLWNTKTGELLKICRGYMGPIHSVLFSPDNKTFATGSNGGSAVVWDTQLGTVVKVFREGPDGPLMAIDKVFTLAFSPDGHTLLTGLTTGVALLWDLETGKKLYSLDVQDGILSAAFSSDGKKVLMGSLYGTISLWDATTGILLKKSQEGKAVHSVAFNSDDTIIFVGFDNSTAFFWEVATGNVLQKLTAESPMFWTSCSPYTTILSASPKGKIIIWNRPLSFTDWSEKMREPAQEIFVTKLYPALKEDDKPSAELEENIQ